MIEESGRVVAVEPGAVWVETLRRSGCGRCDEPGGCGNGALARRARERLGHVRARCMLPLAVGDGVVVGVPETAVARGALLIYLLPMLALVAGGLLGSAWRPGDAGTLAGAVLGLAAGFLALRVLSRRLTADEPVVLRRLAEAPACPRPD